MSGEIRLSEVDKRKIDELVERMDDLSQALLQLSKNVLAFMEIMADEKKRREGF